MRNAARTITSQPGLPRHCSQCVTRLTDHKKGAPCETPFPFPLRFLNHAVAHSHHTLAGPGNLLKCAMAQVQNAPTVVRASIGDNQLHALAIGWIPNVQPRAKWERWVGSGHCLRVHGLAICHGAPSKTITMPVERSFATRRPCLHCSGRQSTSNDGSRKKKTKKHQ
jgi:hypothetical protein